MKAGLCRFWVEVDEGQCAFLRCLSFAATAIGESLVDTKLLYNPVFWKPEQMHGKQLSLESHLSGSTWTLNEIWGLLLQHTELILTGHILNINLFDFHLLNIVSLRPPCPNNVKAQRNS